MPAFLNSRGGIFGQRGQSVWSERSTIIVRSKDKVATEEIVIRGETSATRTDAMGKYHRGFGGRDATACTADSPSVLEGQKVWDQVRYLYIL